MCQCAQPRPPAARWTSCVRTHYIHYIARRPYSIRHSPYPPCSVYHSTRTHTCAHIDRASRRSESIRIFCPRPPPGLVPAHIGNAHHVPPSIAHAPQEAWPCPFHAGSAGRRLAHHAQRVGLVRRVRTHSARQAAARHVEAMSTSSAASSAASFDVERSPRRNHHLCSGGRSGGLHPRPNRHASTARAVGNCTRLHRRSPHGPVVCESGMYVRGACGRRRYSRR